MNTIRNDTQELGAISWSLLATETAADVSLGPLLRSVEQGKPIASDDPTLTSLRPICESLYAEEGVLLYQDQVVVPPSLRRRVLQNLHAAHQGTSSMEQRARAIVYWPGMSKDIRETREGCADCNRNAPSQVATSPLPSTPPLSPFEAVFADFFDYRLGGSPRFNSWDQPRRLSRPSSPFLFLLRYIRRPGGDLKRRWPRVHR